MRGYSHQRDIANDLQEISKSLKLIAKLIELHILESDSRGKCIVDNNALRARIKQIKEESQS